MVYPDPRHRGLLIALPYKPQTVLCEVLNCKTINTKVCALYTDTSLLFHWMMIETTPIIQTFRLMK